MSGEVRHDCAHDAALRQLARKILARWGTQRLSNNSSYEFLWYVESIARKYCTGLDESQLSNCLLIPWLVSLATAECNELAPLIPPSIQAQGGISAIQELQMDWTSQCTQLTNACREMTASTVALHESEAILALLVRMAFTTRVIEEHRDLSFQDEFRIGVWEICKGAWNSLASIVMLLQCSSATQLASQDTQVLFFAAAIFMELLIHLGRICPDTVQLSIAQLRTLANLWSLLARLSSSDPASFEFIGPDSGSLSPPLGSPASCAILVLAKLSTVVLVDHLQVLPAISDTASAELAHLTNSAAFHCTTTPAEIQQVPELDNYSASKHPFCLADNLLEHADNHCSLLRYLFTATPDVIDHSEGGSIASPSSKRLCEDMVPDASKRSSESKGSLDDSSWLFASTTTAHHQDTNCSVGVVRHRQPAQPQKAADGDDEFRGSDERVPCDVLMLLPLLGNPCTTEEAHHIIFLGTLWSVLWAVHRVISHRAWLCNAWRDHHTLLHVIRLCRMRLQSCNDFDTQAFCSSMTCLVNSLAMLVACVPPDPAADFGSIILEVQKTVHHLLSPKGLVSKTSLPNQPEPVIPLVRLARRLHFITEYSWTDSPNLAWILSWWPMINLPRSCWRGEGLPKSNRLVSVDAQAVHSSATQVPMAPFSLVDVDAVRSSASLLDAVFTLIRLVKRSTSTRDMMSSLFETIVSDLRDQHLKWPTDRHDAGHDPGVPNLGSRGEDHTFSNMDSKSLKEKTFAEIFSKPLERAGLEDNSAIGYGGGQSETDQIIQELLAEFAGEKGTHSSHFNGAPVWLHSLANTANVQSDEEILTQIMAEWKKERQYSDLLSMFYLHQSMHHDENRHVHLLEIWSHILMHQGQADSTSLEAIVEACNNVMRRYGSVWVASICVPAVLRILSGTHLASSSEMKETGDGDAYLLSDVPYTLQAAFVLLRNLRGEFVEARKQARGMLAKHLEAHKAVTRLIKEGYGVNRYTETQRRNAIMALSRRQRAFRASLLRSRMAGIALRLSGESLVQAFSLNTACSLTSLSDFGDHRARSQLLRWGAFASRLWGAGLALRPLVTGLLSRLRGYTSASEVERHSPFLSVGNDRQPASKSDANQQNEGEKDLDSIAKVELRVLFGLIPTSDLLFGSTQISYLTLRCIWNVLAQPLLPTLVALPRAYSANVAVSASSEHASLIASAMQLAARISCLQVAAGLIGWESLLDAWAPYPLGIYDGAATCWDRLVEDPNSLGPSGVREFRSENPMSVIHEGHLLMRYVCYVAHACGPSRTGSTASDTSSEHRSNLQVDQHNYLDSPSIFELPPARIRKIMELQPTDVRHSVYLDLANVGWGQDKKDHLLLNSRLVTSSIISPPFFMMNHTSIIALPGLYFGQSFSGKAGSLQHWQHASLDYSSSGGDLKLNSAQLSKYFTLLRNMSIVFYMSLVSEIHATDDHGSFRPNTDGENPSSPKALSKEASALLLTQLMACMGDCITPNQALSQLARFLIRLKDTDQTNLRHRDFLLHELRELVVTMPADLTPDLTKPLSLSLRLHCLRALVKGLLSSLERDTTMNHLYLPSLASTIAVKMLLFDTSSPLHQRVSTLNVALLAMEMIRIFAPLVARSSVLVEITRTGGGSKLILRLQKSWLQLVSLMVQAPQAPPSFRPGPIPPISLHAFAQAIYDSTATSPITKACNEWARTWGYLLDCITKVAFDNLPCLLHVCDCKSSEIITCALVRSCQCLLSVLRPRKRGELGSAVYDIPPTLLEVLHRWLRYGRSSITSSRDAHPASASLNRILFAATSILTNFLRVLSPFTQSSQRDEAHVTTSSFLRELRKVISSIDEVQPVVEGPALLEVLSLPFSRILPAAISPTASPGLRGLMLDGMMLFQEILDRVSGLKQTTSDSTVGLESSPTPSEPGIIAVPILSNEFCALFTTVGITELLKTSANASLKGIATVIGGYLDLVLSDDRRTLVEPPPFVMTVTRVCNDLLSGRPVSKDLDSVHHTDAGPAKREGDDFSDTLLKISETSWNNLVTSLQTVHRFTVECKAERDGNLSNVLTSCVGPWYFAILSMRIARFSIQLMASSSDSTPSSSEPAGQRVDLSTYMRKHLGALTVLKPSDMGNVLPAVASGVTPDTMSIPASTALQILRSCISQIPYGVVSPLIPRSKLVAAGMQPEVAKTEVTEADLNDLASISQTDAPPSLDPLSQVDSGDLLGLVSSNVHAGEVIDLSDTTGKPDSLKKRRVGFAEQVEIIELDVGDDGEEGRAGIFTESRLTLEQLVAYSVADSSADITGATCLTSSSTSSSRASFVGPTSYVAASSLWACLAMSVHSAACSPSLSSDVAYPCTQRTNHSMPALVPTPLFRMATLAPSSLSQHTGPAASFLTASLVVLHNVKWFLTRAAKFAQKNSKQQLQHLVQIQQLFNDLVRSVAKSVLAATCAYLGQYERSVPAEVLTTLEHYICLHLQFTVPHGSQSGLPATTSRKASEGTAGAAQTVVKLE